MSLFLNPTTFFNGALSFMLRFLTKLELFILIPYGIVVFIFVVFDSKHPSAWIIIPLYSAVSIILSIFDRLDFMHTLLFIYPERAILKGRPSLFMQMMGCQQLKEKTNQWMIN